MRPYTADDDFIQRLHAAVRRTFAGHLDTLDEPWPPSPGDLAMVLNVACRLATQQYEKEPIFTRLLLFNASRQYPGFFDTPRAPLAQLRALATAFPEGVALHTHEGALIPYAGATLDWPLPQDAPCVSFSVSPGRVAVTLAGRLLALVPLGEEPILPAGQWNELHRVVRTAGLSEQSLLSPDDLAIIAANARRHGHGAAIVVAPADATIERADDVGAMLGEPIIWELAADVAQVASKPPTLMHPQVQAMGKSGLPFARELAGAAMQKMSDHAKATLSSYRNALARMTRADGAVFVRQDWAVLGFGMRLKPATSVDHVIRRDVGRAGEREVATAELGGTRIQSAASSIASRPNDEHGQRWFGLVLSADGPVRLIHRESERVVVTCGIEAFL